VAIGAGGGDVVRFVHDHDVPACSADRGQDLRSLDVIDGRDDQRLDDPRVDPHGQLGAAASDFAHVEQRRDEVEARSQLVHPLLAQAGRRQDQRARRGAASLELGRDQRSLNGLAEADFVGDQHTRSVAANNGEHWLELVRHQIDSRARGGPEHRCWAVAGDEVAAGAAPRCCAHGRGRRLTGTGWMRSKGARTWRSVRRFPSSTPASVSSSQCSYATTWVTSQRWRRTSTRAPMRARGSSDREICTSPLRLARRICQSRSAPASIAEEFLRSRELGRLNWQPRCHVPPRQSLDRCQTPI
jgi:hypothetical protein